MYGNDPNRFERPTVDPDAAPPVSPQWALGGLVALALLALAFVFWPGGERPATVTENAPVYRAPTAPATPPANKPVTPAPTPPQ
jgi:hypothetical protein